ncbi:unnamed protein product, partial [Cuscuta epithymum]
MAATMNAVEANRYDGSDDAGLGWTWKDIFGPSPTNTPAVLEECAVAPEVGMQDDEDTTENILRREGVEHAPAAMQGDEGASDGNTVEAEQDAYAQEDEQEDVSVVAPVVGMKFESTDAVYEFYKKYGRTVGFPVRKRTSTKDRSKGVVVSIVIECSRAGSRGSKALNCLKPQPSMQTSCTA